MTFLQWLGVAGVFASILGALLGWAARYNGKVTRNLISSLIKEMRDEMQKMMENTQKMIQDTQKMIQDTQKMMQETQKMMQETQKMIYEMDKRHTELLCRILQKVT